jgi:hypothetical protein
VLFAWIGISLVTLPLVQFFVWRKARREHEKEHGRRDSEETAS